MDEPQHLLWTVRYITRSYEEKVEKDGQPSSVSTCNICNNKDKLKDVREILCYFNRCPLASHTLCSFKWYDHSCNCSEYINREDEILIPDVQIDSDLTCDLCFSETKDVEKVFCPNGCSLSLHEHCARSWFSKSSTCLRCCIGPDAVPVYQRELVTENYTASIQVHQKKSNKKTVAPVRQRKSNKKTVAPVRQRKFDKKDEEAKKSQIKCDMISNLSSDMMRYIFGFVKERDMFSYRSVSKHFKANITPSVVTAVDFGETPYAWNSIPNVFKNLRVLICRNLNLTEIPYIAGLKELDCSCNDLTQIPNIVGLKRLNCALNDLVNIPHIVGLEILDCSFNSATEIPHIVGLKTLGCKNNNLTRIPHIDGLEILNCEFNQLTEIPNIIGLRRLNCSTNSLTKIPNIVGLEVLNCSNNELTDIPNIDGLEILDCSCNQLTEIPDIVGLVNLNCELNYLTEIPHIVELEFLNCSYNLVDEIPHIVGLRTLICISCQLTEIPAIVGLEELRCDGNILHEIPDIDGLELFL